jgi:hypothetical protein
VLLAGCIAICQRKLRESRVQSGIKAQCLAFRAIQVPPDTSSLASAAGRCGLRWRIVCLWHSVARCCKTPSLLFQQMLGTEYGVHTWRKMQIRICTRYSSLAYTGPCKSPRNLSLVRAHSPTIRMILCSRLFEVQVMLLCHCHHEVCGLMCQIAPMNERGPGPVLQCLDARRDTGSDQADTYVHRSHIVHNLRT